MTDLWLRQEWDTDTSFDRFTRYYLSQDLPRSVDEAYRRWAINENGFSPEQARKRQASGIWKQWGWPKGHPSWGDRAAAFDDHIATLRIAELEARAMPPKEVIAELSDIARGNIRKFADVAIMQDLTRLDEDDSKLIQDIANDIRQDKEGGITNRLRLKMYSRLDALEKLARHYGLFNDVGSSEDKPFILKVVYGNNPDHSAKDSPPETS